MRIHIVGQDSLARATHECAARHFQIVPAADHPDILWVCYDTPIGANDHPDVARVMQWLESDLQYVSPETLVLVSSQLPVGTTGQLELAWPALTFAYSPENIRVATAVADFTSQARIVIGRRDPRHDDVWRTLVAPFTDHLILTDPETAEMIKHALNCWLGLSIAFINEVARLARAVDADPDVVALGLMTDRRVSPNAPLRPGPPFGGGHLARDIAVVTDLVTRHGIHAPLLTQIMSSNNGL